MSNLPNQTRSSTKKTLEQKSNMLLTYGLAVAVGLIVFAIIWHNAGFSLPSSHQAEKVLVDDYSTCFHKAIAYHQEYGEYPVLKNGEQALPKIQEQCKENPSAYANYTPKIKSMTNDRSSNGGSMTATFYSMQSCLVGIRSSTGSQLNIGTDTPQRVGGTLSGGGLFSCEKITTGSKGTYYEGWYSK